LAAAGGDKKAFLNKWKSQCKKIY